LQTQRPLMSSAPSHKTTMKAWILVNRAFYLGTWLCYRP